MLFEATNHCSLSRSCVCDIPSECPAGMFGLGCRHRCQCDNKALCDHVSGACTCQVGWTGTFCEKRKRSFLIAEPTSPSEYVYMLLTGSHLCVCFSVSSGFLWAGLPGKVFVSERWELWCCQRSLLLYRWLDRSLLQPKWVTGAKQRVQRAHRVWCPFLLWRKGGIRGSDVLYLDICVAAPRTSL